MRIVKFFTPNNILLTFTSIFKSDFVHMKSYIIVTNQELLYKRTTYSPIFEPGWGATLNYLKNEYSRVARILTSVQQYTAGAHIMNYIVLNLNTLPRSGSEWPVDQA